MRILLVDDDSGSLRGMQLALGMLKHQCDAYSDPVKAMKCYCREVHDLLITDIHMPVVSGLLLARQIRSINPQAKIIFISGNTNQLCKKKPEPIHDFFLHKPVDFAFLKQLLDRIADADKPLC